MIQAHRAVGSGADDSATNIYRGVSPKDRYRRIALYPVGTQLVLTTHIMSSFVMRVHVFY